MTVRNDAIFARRGAGDTLERIGADYGITKQRVLQILTNRARSRRMQDTDALREQRVLYRRSLPEENGTSLLFERVQEGDRWLAQKAGEKAHLSRLVVSVYVNGRLMVDWQDREDQMHTCTAHSFYQAMTRLGFVPAPDPDFWREWDQVVAEMAAEAADAA